MKKSMWKFEGSIKKKWSFQGCWRKAHVEFPWVLDFDLEISKGYHTILQNFQGWKLVFGIISKDKVIILKIPPGFFKKGYLPVRIFSHFQTLQWIGKNLEKQPRPFDNPNFLSLLWIWKNLEVYIAQDQHFRIQILNLWINWKKLYPNLSFTVENKMEKSHKKRMVTF